MACHYQDAGFTAIVVGGEYVRFLQYPGRPCKVQRVNEATGIVTVIRAHARVGYISATELSQWHRVS